MGTQILEIEDDWIVTGTPSVMGAHKSLLNTILLQVLYVTGALHENITWLQALMLQALKKKIYLLLVLHLQALNGVM